MADLLVNLHQIRKAAVGEAINFVGVLNNPTGNLTFQDPNANSGNPVTLSQLIAGISPPPGFFIDHDDTPANWGSSALKFLRVNGAGDGVEFVTVNPSTTFKALTDTPDPYVADRLPFANAVPDALIYDDEVRADNLKTAEPTASGVLGQGHGALSWTDATDFLVDSGNAKLQERVSDKHFRHHLTTWGTQAITVPGGVLSDPYGVVVAEDPGFTGSATIVAVNLSTATVAYMRSRSRLGYTVHEAGALIAVINAPDVWKDAVQASEDLWDIVGVQKLAGTGIHQEVGGGYTSKVTAATLKYRGLNFHTSPADPNTKAVAASPVPLLFDTVRNTGAVFATGISVFPKTWDNAGTETALTGKKAAVAQVYQLPGRAIAVAQLGTTVHNDFATAKAAIVEEIINNALPAIAQRIGFRLSYVIIGNDSTQWVDANAEIIPAQAIGGGVAAASGGFPIYDFPAAKLTSSNTANWAINGNAPLVADSNNSGLSVRMADDATEEGFGQRFTVPTGAASMQVFTSARAESTPGGAVVAKPLIRFREITDGGAVGSWGSPIALADIDLAANEFFVADQKDDTLANWILTVAKRYQFQVTRTSTANTLSGDLAWESVRLEFS